MDWCRTALYPLSVRIRLHPLTSKAKAKLCRHDTFVVATHGAAARCLIRRPAMSDLPKALVINLARRTDRWSRVSEKLQNLGVKFIRWEATDGQREDAPEELVAKWWTHGSIPVGEDFGKWWDEDIHVLLHRDYCAVKMSAGERACAMSHIRAWMSHGEASPLMVFEDDAEPYDDFVEITSLAIQALKEDEPPDLLFLGWGHWTSWRRCAARFEHEHAHYRILEAEAPLCCHAYIMWPTCAKKLLERLPVDAPFDHWIEKACMDRTIISYCLVQTQPWSENQGQPIPGDGSPDSDEMGGIVWQYQDASDTRGCRTQPSHLLWLHRLMRSGGPNAGFGIQPNPTTSNLRKVLLSDSWHQDLSGRVALWCDSDPNVWLSAGTFQSNGLHVRTFTDPETLLNVYRGSPSTVACIVTSMMERNSRKERGLMNAYGLLEAVRAEAEIADAPMPIFAVVSQTTGAKEAMAAGADVATDSREEVQSKILNMISEGVLLSRRRGRGTCLSSLTRDALREELRRRSLRVSGLKEELVQRLRWHIERGADPGDIILD